MPLKSWKQLAEDSADTQVSFEPLPDGVYDFVITDAEHRRSQSGKDGYNVTAEVETGPYKKRRVFNTFWVSPDSPVAMGIFFRQFGVLGLDSAFFATEPSDEQIVAKLKGARFRGTTKVSEWQGKKRNEISNVAEPNPSISVGGPAASSGVPTISDAPTVASTPVVDAPTPSPAPVAETPSVPSQPAAAAPASENPWDGATVPGVPSGVPSGAPSRPF